MQEKSEVKNQEATLAVVVDRLSSLHEDVNDLRDSMRESMKEMATAVTRLVEMEQRQVYAMKAVERQEEQITKLSERVSEIEKSQPITALVVSWVQRVVMVAVGVVLAFVAKAVGLI